MKKLLSPGNTLIVPSARFARPQPDGLIHNVWLSHAYAGFGSQFAIPCASGAGVFGFVFEFAVTGFYYYPIFLGDPSEVIELADFYAGRPFIGEDWNFTLRQAVFDKVASADWGAWLASH